jgi:aminopeptidase N
MRRAPSLSACSSCWSATTPFRRGCDLYFERLDGSAATMEQFLDCFAETLGRDLSRFLRWYEQPGTPT